MESIQPNREIMTSFSNPNYTFNHSDALNCNFFSPDNDNAHRPLNDASSGEDEHHSSSDSEGHYSTESCATTPAETILSMHHLTSVEEELDQSGFSGFYTRVQARKGPAVQKLIKAEPAEDIAEPSGSGADPASADSGDSGIQTDDLNKSQNASKVTDEQTVKPSSFLLSGWEQCTDEEGPYYWHIKSGTIQREVPTSSDTPGTQAPLKSTDSALPWIEANSPHTGDVSEVRELRCSSQRYAVRSLGWIPIAEEDLTQDRSSRAVNKCIVDLSFGRNDINDVVGRWGDGKDLFLELDPENLTLMDTNDLSVLNVQPIQSIRVWGVGRDNGRDFAYVSRDRATKRYMCHVFRCDTPARQIANTLRDLCQRIVIQRGIQQVQMNRRAPASRPTDLPNLEKLTTESSEETLKRLLHMTSFATPLDEPKKVLQCHYLGTESVSRPTGVDVLNSAMDKVYARVPPEEWKFVSVAIAPSTITVCDSGNAEVVYAECRVRFLTFMGIAQRNVKLCSFIMHTAQDQFVAHVFHGEPSAGALCKTIEAACKLRYQKCLDAHQKQINEPGQAGRTNVIVPKSSIRQSFQNVLDRFRRKSITS